MCRAILETGTMRDNWEPWVTDRKRGAGYVRVSPNGLQGSCSSGNLGLEGGVGMEEGKGPARNTELSPPPSSFLLECGAGQAGVLPLRQVPSRMPCWG